METFKAIFPRNGFDLPCSPFVKTEPRPAPKSNTEPPKRTYVVVCDLPRSELKKIAETHKCVPAHVHRALVEIQIEDDRIRQLMIEDPVAKHAEALSAWAAKTSKGEAGLCPRAEDFIESHRQRLNVLRAEQRRLQEQTREHALVIFERIRPHFSELVSNYVIREQELAKALNFSPPDETEFPGIAAALKSALHRFDELVRTGLRGSPRDVLAGVVEFPTQ